MQTFNAGYIIERLKQCFDCKTNDELAKHLEISKGTIGSWKSRNSIDIKLLIAKCNHVNLDWLLTGKGEMLFNESKTEVQSFTLKTDKNIEKQLIPVYNIEASAGLVNLFDSSKHQEIVDTIKIPNLPSCDGAVFVQGDSMYPLLKSGDIVAYKQITDFKNDIYWGEMYLISVEMAGEEYVSVKFIQKSEKGEDYICLVSQNQHHASKDVHLGKVRAMALIKASIRLNSMS